MNQDEQEKLNRLLDRLPKGDYPLDQWLAEDETATYDALVAERRRRLTLRRWAAVAAGIVIVIGIGAVLTLNGGRGQQPQPVAVATVSGQAPVGRDVTDVRGATNSAAVTDSSTATGSRGAANSLAHANASGPAATTPYATATPYAATAPALAGSRRLTPIDSLTDIVARIEAGLQGISDSCYQANVEKLIRADVRLQHLVNRLVLEGIMADTTLQTAAIKD